MSTASLFWTPGGGPNVTSQEVQYRVKTPTNDGAWTTGASGLGPTVNSQNITAAFIPNRIYNFQIVDICSEGGPQPSNIFDMVKLTCPDLMLSQTSTSITVRWTDLGESVDKYIVKLYDSTGANLLQSHVKLPPYNIDPIGDTFLGLAPVTTYKVKVEVYAGNFSKLDCPLTTVATPATPVCTAPTGLTVSMS